MPDRRRLARIVVALLLSMLLLPAALTSKMNVFGWSNGGYSTDPSNPDYATHDWTAQHALDWLPSEEKQFILDNLAAYLYGTELPDNGEAPDGIGDTVKHHVYYWANGSLQDDSSAFRAWQEYNDALVYLSVSNYSMAAKSAGMMSHYIVDVGVFGHVMGSSTDWGGETHHSDYEGYVETRTSNYSAQFDSYLSFDGSLEQISAYNATLKLAYETTFDTDGGLTCVWMDQHYNWSDPTFKYRAGESLNLAVNILADVFHALYLARMNWHEPWDITGQTKWIPDNKCDIRDIATAARLFGSVMGDGRYDYRADITSPTYLVPDGKIDMRDLALIARHFGETYS